MELRQLGRSDLRIAPLVLGGNVFGWNVDAKMSFAILDAFVDAGFNAVDTADSYSRWVPGHIGGESETIIGKWLKQTGKRDKVVILTKFGEDVGEGRSTKKDYMQRAAAASLRRLQTDRIDLYQTQFDDEVTPVEETMTGFVQLVAEGKVRAAGASNLSPERFAASLEASKRLGLSRYESLQPLYNLSDRNEFESGYEPICRREQIGVIPYYGLAAGFLTGKYKTAADAEKNPARGGRLKKYINPRGDRILAAIGQVAMKYEATYAQVALAWLINRVTAPIVSVTNVEQLADIIKAPRLKLTAEDMAALTAAGN